MEEEDELLLLLNYVSSEQTDKAENMNIQLLKMNKGTELNWDQGDAVSSQ